ncbi:bacteriocin production protein [Jeongeupia sp. HS-3]|uniref:CvpA family protein n=1 Tax=Jeongeupia sp. HS-3 TaxID=1009682 RepID=UPI0018A35390|nr:CvpA family protein [Jeongeupia sp. HS-3]BCL75431.1 bacteriocin production protein [Jeongeupia sp. HS-3]
MTGFDYAVLAILGLSILLSVMRGLTQEVLALAGWVVSAWLALNYAAAISVFMPAALPNEGLRYLAALVVVFCAAWLLTAIVRITLNQFIKATGLKPVDRLLGVFFGLVRGSLFVVLLVLAAGLTGLPKTDLWRNAMFSPLFEQAARMSLPWLPEALAGRVSFD